MQIIYKPHSYRLVGGGGGGGGGGGSGRGWGRGGWLVAKFRVVCAVLGM